MDVEKRVIGAVRNAGASEALGEVLVFVDADIRMHRETFNEMDRALATGRVVGGATGVRLERLSWASRSRTPRSCRWSG